MENKVLDILSMPYEEAVIAVMAALGMNRSAAELFVSISKGEVEGDFVGVTIPSESGGYRLDDSETGFGLYSKQ